MAVNNTPADENLGPELQIVQPEPDVQRPAQMIVKEHMLASEMELTSESMTPMTFDPDRVSKSKLSLISA